MSRRAWAAMALAAVTAMTPLLAGCSDDTPDQPQTGSDGPATGGATAHGPMFPECGGISDETVGQLTQVSGLVNTARTSVGCQWLLGGQINGPHFSFSWFRGSPIGRERKTEELSRTSVDDINIEGHDGFIAVGTDPMLNVDNLCEIGIQFGDDFVEWSVSFASQPFPNPCDVAKELTRQSIVNSK